MLLYSFLAARIKGFLKEKLAHELRQNNREILIEPATEFDTYEEKTSSDVRWLSILNPARRN